MGSTNKVMEAKNHKVRTYDMEHNNYVNNGEVSLEYMFHERTTPKDGLSIYKRHRNAMIIRRFKMVGGC